ncbi:UNVERIFIED_CONTAM: hypothetical protein FKN15_026576 [Acipenser sinensis]
MDRSGAVELSPIAVPNDYENRGETKTEDAYETLQFNNPAERKAQTVTSRWVCPAQLLHSTGFLASRTGSQSFWVEPSGGEEDTDLKLEYSGDNLEDLFSKDEDQPLISGHRWPPNHSPDVTQAPQGAGRSIPSLILSAERQAEDRDDESFAQSD